MLSENKIREIYVRLQDESSCCIYADRLLYSLTGDEKFLYHLVKQYTTGGGRLIQALREHANCPKVLFGAGFWGRRLRRFFPEAGWTCFVDNKVAPDTEVDGLPVLSLEQLCEKFPEAFVVISTRLYFTQIKQQLLAAGFVSQSICSIGEEQNEMIAQQYFDRDIMTPCESEAFVDGGAFDGATSAAFRRWTNGKFANIWAFEPDGKMAAHCCELFKDYSREKIINKGLWCRTSKLSFQLDGSLSTVSEYDGGGQEVSVVALDEMLRNERVTFIKLDVEGSELEALKGAEKIIREQKPKLAISVYHKPQDIWELPELILTYCPNYKFYMRHYTMCEYDTVLYAV